MSRNSDRRKIKDVQNITGEYALKKIVSLQTVSYRHIDEDPSLPISIGWIAQDFAKEFPDLIRKRKKDDGVMPIKKPREPGLPVETQPEIPVEREPGTIEPQPTQPEPEPTPLSLRFTSDPMLLEGESPAEDESDVATSPEGYQITSYEELIPLMASAIKELNTRLELSDIRIKQLEKKVLKLENPTT